MYVRNAKFHNVMCMYTIKLYYTTANTESTPISLSCLMHGQSSACQHTFQV